ncbi:expressed unknown protein [Seminavis robusta]|uniref:Uncharacterized protein n=1 Tax=Seminavis robusta TaxID=568900 RepID=A0A9N8ETK6_9STRA|nr:expressed unknown protein [Seminavis robusta]|eukprot:Sro1649_g288550.1 n/a (126) ;mRNA; r:1051-1428
MTRKNSLGLVKVRKANRAAKHSVKRSEAKAVRFSKTPEVAFRHVTQDELQKTWYKPQEYDAFKEDCKRTAAYYRNAQGDITRLDPVKVCLRGLEQNLTRISIMSRRITITSSVNMVLHEQGMEPR